MSAGAVVETKSLEDRIAEKMAQEIGDMITADDMREMVKKGVRKALFHKREKPDGSWRNDTVTVPCLVDEMVEKHLSTKMREAVAEWLTAHPEDIQKAIDRAIDGGVMSAIQRAMDDRFAGIFDAGTATLQARGLLPAGQV